MLAEVFGDGEMGLQVTFTPFSVLLYVFHFLMMLYNWKRKHNRRYFSKKEQMPSKVIQYRVT